MHEIKPIEKMRRARVMLLRKQPFFGTLAIQLELIEDPAIPTLATNGTYIRFNPTFISALPSEVLQAAIAHEVMHVVLMHLTRRGEREHGRWNRAGDFVINGTLKECGFTLGEGWLYSEKLLHKTSDEVYNLLKSEEGEGGGGGEPGAPGSGGGSPQPGKSGCGWYVECDHAHGEQVKDLEDKTKQMVASVAAAMQGVGNLPGSLKALIDAILYKPQDWRQMLRHFVEEATRDDYSWTRPNSRYIGRGICLPSLRGRRIKPFVIAFDISGSVDSELVKQFVGAVNDLMMEIKPESVELVQCDTQIQKHESYQPEDMPLRTMEIVRGGGTDFKPVFDWIEDQGLDPSGLIYFTDMLVGQSEFPKGGCDYPVIWVVPQNANAKTAPFGTTVKMF